MSADKNEAKWDMPDDDSYADLLRLADLWRGPSIRAAVESLNLPSGSRGLDAGCGIGQHTLWLAEAVAPAGHVVGLDLSPEFVKRGMALAQQAGLSEHASFRDGDLNHLPFDDDAFDWLWSADTVYFGPSDQGYAAEDPAPLMRELSRVVKPGGRINLVYCAAQNLLPGFPLLEARLNAVSAEGEPFVQGKNPKLHSLRALDWLREAGLKSLSANTVACGVQAPLGDELRGALAGLLKYRWGADPLSKLTPEDAADYQRLCQPDSPDFILDLPDYCTFFTCSVFSGRVVQ